MKIDFGEKAMDIGTPAFNFMRTCRPKPSSTISSDGGMWIATGSRCSAHPSDRSSRCVLYGEAEAAQSDERVALSALRFLSKLTAPLSLQLFGSDEGWAATHCPLFLHALILLADPKRPWPQDFAGELTHTMLNGIAATQPARRPRSRKAERAGM